MPGHKKYVYQGDHLEFQNGVILIRVSDEIDTIWCDNFSCNGFYHFHVIKSMLIIPESVM